jgi:hypothetical protein
MKAPCHKYLIDSLCIVPRGTGIARSDVNEATYQT